MRSEGPAERIGVKEVLNSLEEKVVPSILRGEPTILHVELPTGYGKSMTSALIAQKLASGEGGLAEYVHRVIHVVPTRYLVEDLVRGARSLTKGTAEGGLVVRGQSMFFDPSLKDPYFLSDLVFTTLDSYALNFFKVPVAEADLIRAGFTHGHFDVPRYAVLSAVNVFDEYHVLVPGDVEVGGYIAHERAWTALNVMVEHLVKSCVPVMLETATPRPDALTGLRKHLQGEARVRLLRVALKLRRDSEAADDVVAVYDDDFSAKLEEAGYETGLEEGRLVEVVLKHVDEMEKPLLVACNNIRTAVEVYHVLEGRGKWRAYLMHSLFTMGDRKRALTRLHRLMESKGRADLVVVATQVIEVGVNLDFASMITDAAPLASLVQRAGRVNRRLAERTSRILVVYDSSQAREDAKTYAGVYDLELTRLTLKVLSEVERKGGVGWRMSVVEEDVEVDGKTVATVPALSKLIYRSSETPQIDWRYQKTLLTLLNYQIGSDVASDCLRQLGSLVRDDVLAPVYVPPEEFEKGSLSALRRDQLVACPTSKLGFDLEKESVNFKAAGKVLKLEDDRLWVIVEREREGYEAVKLSPRSVIEGLMNGAVKVEGRWGLLRALVAEPRAYSRKEGLKIW
jgi:CRISPR-associated helicase Cas3